jgi:hypothetical protein
MLSVGLNCSDLLLVMLVVLLPVVLLMETISTFCFLSLNPFSRLLPALAVGLLDKALFPPLELNIVFRSLDSTLSELPVDNLVMVTDPVEEEEEEVVVGAQIEDCVVNVAEEAQDINDDDELVLLLLKTCLLVVVVVESVCSLVVLDEEDLTGEIVTLLLLLLLLMLSFFCGELAPKRCPSSSSTLSKADAVDIAAL